MSGKWFKRNVFEVWQAVSCLLKAKAIYNYAIILLAAKDTIIILYNYN